MGGAMILWAQRHATDMMICKDKVSAKMYTFDGKPNCLGPIIKNYHIVHDDLSTILVAKEYSRE